MRSNLSGLYAITDPTLLPGAKLLEGVEAALKGGVRVLQYRNKNASTEQQLEEAKALRVLTRDYQALLIINDNLKLCLEAEADGLHLGKSDGCITTARAALGPDKILGVTCHSDLAYAQECRILGADYFAFGRLFPSQTKPSAPACQLSVLHEAKQLGLCSVAIGGIELNNIDQVIATGVSLVAIIHGLFAAGDIEARAQALSEKFTRSTTT